MGSAADRLNIPEHLRPWHSAGLEYLLPSGKGDSPAADSSGVQQSGAGEAPARVELSKEWEAVLAKSPASPKVAWTYFQLGFDLCGQADPARGQLLRQIIAHLRWPKGSSGFLPVGLPDGGSIVPDPAAFWTGIERLGASDIVCLGHQAAQVLCTDYAGQQTVNLSPYTLHVLPSLDELGPMLPHDRLLHLDRLAAIRF